MDPLTVQSVILYAVIGTFSLVFFFMFLQLSIKASSNGLFLDTLTSLACALLTPAGVVWALYGLSDPTNYPWEPITRLLK